MGTPATSQEPHPYVIGVLRVEKKCRGPESDRPKLEDRLYRLLCDLGQVSYPL